MLDRLPEFIDPVQLADKRGAIKGTFPLTALSRLQDTLFDNMGTVAFALFFARDGRLATVQGQIETVLRLKCQNCLEAVELTINNPVKLGILTSIDQADKLSEDYEPLLLESDTVRLKDIIEDEILLCLPQFPKHEHQCFASIENTEKADSSLTGDSSNTRNPFSILANLKKTGDS